LDAPVTYKYTPTGNGALLDRTGTQRELGDPRNGYRMGLSQNWTIQRIWGKKKLLGCKSWMIQSGNGKTSCSIGKRSVKTWFICCLVRLPES
jgi:hypothetical protein